jgi:hypothetical protein
MIFMEVPRRKRRSRLKVRVKEAGIRLLRCFEEIVVSVASPQTLRPALRSAFIKDDALGQGSTFGITPPTVKVDRHSAIAPKLELPVSVYLFEP